MQTGARWWLLGVLLAGLAGGMVMHEWLSRPATPALARQEPPADGNNRRDAPGDASAARAVQDAVVAVANRARPSVVSITSSSGFDKIKQDILSDPIITQRSGGSGIVVSADGFILTNLHVIRNVVEAMHAPVPRRLREWIQFNDITVVLADQREFKAVVHGVDPYTDLAVIKIDAAGLAPAEFAGDAAVQAGQFAIAVGAPFGYTQSVTLGVVSAVGRNRVVNLTYENFIQTDAAINPGNSGGPLYDLDGRVIGVNTAIFSRTGGYEGIGFAIPADTTVWVMRQLIDHKEVRRGYIGLRTADVDSQIAYQLKLDPVAGVFVQEAMPGQPGDRAGLQVGDIILAADGKSMANSFIFRDFIARSTVGGTVTLDILRRGRPEKIAVTIGAWPEE